MHDCSMCGCACYCHGDIDDCQVETIECAWMHCDGCGCGEDPDGWDDGDWMDDYSEPDEYADDGSYESEWDWIVRAHEEWVESREYLSHPRADILSPDILDTPR